MRVVRRSGERPTAFAPYALGTMLTACSAFALLLGAVGGYADDPGGSRATFVLLVAAPAAMLCFGLLSAVPRRRRRRRLEFVVPDHPIVEVIVLPATRSTLHLEDELRRSYTASLVFTPEGFTVWKRGTFGVRRCGDVVYRMSDVATGTARVSSVTVAALIGTLDDGSSLALPVVHPASLVNMSAGSTYVDDVVRGVASSA